MTLHLLALCRSLRVRGAKWISVHGAQGIGELIEKIARSLAGVKLELRIVTKLVTVHVHIHRSGMTLQDEDVSVELVPDRYYDIMSTTLQVCLPLLPDNHAGHLNSYT